MDTADYDYDLPPGHIAQTPIEPRDAARLLVDTVDGIAHRHVRDLPELLHRGDLLVMNRTRVLPARLRLVKETGGAAEVLLLEERRDLGDGCWEALVRPGRRLSPGTRLSHPATPSLLSVEVGEDLGDGIRRVTLRTDPYLHVSEGIEAAGEIPLPPYIHTPLADPDRYQTVYAHLRSFPGRSESVAAPTAGLHLTRPLLDELAAFVQPAEVELAVGLGTFRPITADRVEDHVMHAERYHVPEATLDACIATQRRGGQVVAVGTTTVRALESVAATGELDGRTDLFIHPGFEFQLVDRLLTNFHTPRSSLLAMIDAFLGANPGGSRRWRDLYGEALARDYRFLSFGDAMLIDRHDHDGRDG